MKFKEWFDNWDRTNNPEVRHLCEIAFKVGYDWARTMATTRARRTLSLNKQAAVYTRFRLLTFAGNVAADVIPNT